MLGEILSSAFVRAQTQHILRRSDCRSLALGHRFIRRRCSSIPTCLVRRAPRPARTQEHLKRCHIMHVPRGHPAFSAAGSPAGQPATMIMRPAERGVRGYMPPCCCAWPRAGPSPAHGIGIYLLLSSVLELASSTVVLARSPPVAHEPAATLAQLLHQIALLPLLVPSCTYTRRPSYIVSILVW
jgi:hypothetical protein